MKAKSDEANIEEAMGSITEAIGKITANPSTEKKGAEMKKDAQQRKASDIASDTSDGNANS